MKQITVCTKNLSKSFKQRLLFSNLSFEAYPGETIAITGKSGEGKTTLLQILGTLEDPSSGFVEICGTRASRSTSPSLRNRHIGFVFQQFHLIEDLSVYDNVLMPAKIAREPTGKNSLASIRTLQLLEEVGLTKLAFSPAKLLSGGEKQRVAIARALCNDPDLILADEPSGNLDEENSEKIHDLLLSCTKKWNKTVIIVTHDETLAAQSDRRFILKNGLLCAY